jgi:hypothetical protein
MLTGGLGGSSLLDYPDTTDPYAGLTDDEFSGLIDSMWSDTSAGGVDIYQFGADTSGGGWFDFGGDFTDYGGG